MKLVHAPQQGGARKRGMYDHPQAPFHQERLQQIQEGLEQKPDRDDLENGLSDVLFKLEENEQTT